MSSTSSTTDNTQSGFYCSSHGCQQLRSFPRGQRPKQNLSSGIPTPHVPEFIGITREDAKMSFITTEPSLSTPRPHL